MRLTLIGGDEFSPACDSIDRRLLPGRPREAVRVLPTAAAHERPERAAQNGVQHFRRLGAVDVQAVMVVDRATADDPRLALQLRSAGLIYLTGGDPAHLLDSLVGSAALEALEAAVAAGAALAGSSAGAMVLASWMRPPGRRWRRGLGLAPGVAVLPHHEQRGSERAAAYREGLPEEVVLFGIDGATGLIREERSWLVAGQGTVTVYGPQGIARLAPGERYALGQSDRRG